MRRNLLPLLGLALATSACLFSPDKNAASAGRLDPPGILEVRFQVDSLGPGTQVLSDAEQGDVLLGPAYLFGLSQVWASTDDLGRPALTLKVTETDAQAFSDLSAEHVGETMALIVAKEVVSLATVYARLPGSAMISGDFTPEYVENLVAKLKGAR